MSRENIDVIREMYDAFDKGDVPTVLEQMDQSIEWKEAENFIYADRSPYMGPQAIVDGVFRRLGTEWERFTVTPEEWLDAGNQVVVLGTYTGRHMASGREVRAQFAHVWGIKSGRVVRFQHYTDTKQFAEVTA